MDSRARYLHQSLGVNVVAGIHGDPVVPFRLHRRLAPPRVGIVDHVVVDKRSRVNQLQRHSDILQLLQIVISELSAEQDEDRPKTFAARLQQVQGRLAKQLVIAVDAPVQLPFDKIHVFFECTENIQ